MGLFSNFLIGSVGVVALGVFIAYINVPVYPDTASNHGIKVTFGLFIKLVVFTSDFGSSMGFSKASIMRSMFNILSVVTPSSPDVEEETKMIEGIEVLIMRPANSRDGELRPGIIHYHGGGWVLLTPTAYAPVIREMVKQTQAVVVSVNYRLAPEHLFPAAIEDCLKVTRYFLRNAADYGVDKNRVGIKGDSAGGNLAMAATLVLTKENDPDLPEVKFMSLDYPALQTFDFFLPCYVQYEKGPGFLNKKVMIDYWLLYAFGDLNYFDFFAKNAHLSKEIRQSQYAQRVSSTHLPKRYQDVLKGKDLTPKEEVPRELKEKIENIVLDPLFSPLMAADEDLAKLPTTYIMNAEFDTLRDDGFIAAERLRKAGVEVEHSFLPDEEHGFLNIIDLDPNLRKEYINFAKFFNKTVS